MSATRNPSIVLKIAGAAERHGTVGLIPVILRTGSSNEGPPAPICPSDG